MLSKRVFSVLLITAYLFMIEYLFTLVVAHFSHVQGYDRFFSISIENTILNILLCIAVSFSLPLKSKKPSETILWAVYFMHFVPSIMTYGHLLFPSTLLWPLILSFVFSIITLLSRIDFKVLPLTGRFVFSYTSYKKQLFFIIVLSSVFCLVWVVKEHGFSLTPPNITDVYGVRSEYKSNLSFLGGYIIVISGYALAPFVVLLGVYLLSLKKQLQGLFLICLSFLISYTIYASSGLKSVAFSSIISLVFYLSLKKFTSSGMFILCFCFCLISIGLALYHFADINIVALHWLRRVFLVPGMNVNYYFEFFNINGGKWDNAPLVISQVYYGTNGSANSGVFGDALAKYGWLGLLINSILLVIIIKLADIAVHSGSSSLASSLFFIIAYALSNSGTTTVFLTYGFIVIFFLLRLSARFFQGVNYE